MMRDLDNAGSIEKIAGKWFRLGFGYAGMNQVMKVLKDMDLRQKDQDFGNDCSLKAWVRLSSEADFLDRISVIEGCSTEEIK